MGYFENDFPQRLGVYKELLRGFLDEINLGLLSALVGYIEYLIFQRHGVHKCDI